MKNTKSVATIKTKSLLSLFAIATILTLNSCKQDTNHNELSILDDTLSVPVPSAVLAVTSDNLVVEVVIDGGSPQTCTNLIIDFFRSYECELTLLQGFHSLSLVYSINDANFGLVQVVTTSSIDAEVIPGQQTSVGFGSATNTYTDSDNDGFPNLNELDNGSNPLDGSDPTPIALNFSDTGQSLGTGSFSSGTDGSMSVALGDVDGDGDLDMVLANLGSSSRIFTNNGLGAFTDTDQPLGDLASSTSVALGDLDGDGDLDLVVANDFGRHNLVYLNDGLGIFTDTNQFLGLNDSQSVALGDLDGDGDLDMAVGNGSIENQGNRIYMNNGFGTFTDTNQSLGSNTSQSIALGDVDGDGDLDVVDANQVFTNNGLGVFTNTNQTLDMNFFSNSIALGDVDGDLDLDLVVGHRGGGTHVYTNNGLGIFTNTNQSLDIITSAVSSIALGDVDGDGDLDVVAALQVGFSNANNVYVNDGDGVFTDTNQYLGSNNSTYVALGDVDGDGDLDMVVTNFNSGNRVYLND